MSQFHVNSDTNICVSKGKCFIGAVFWLLLKNMNDKL